MLPVSNNPSTHPLMHFIPFFSLVASVMAALTFGSPTKRQGPPSGLPIVVLESPGSITSPDAGTSMGAGEDVAFDITVPEWNHCHPAYTPVNVYLLDHQPTTSDLNSTYGFGEFLHYFGEYMVINFPGTFFRHVHAYDARM